MAEAAGDIFGPINAELNDLTGLTTILDVDNAIATAAAAKAHGVYGYQFSWATNDGCQAYASFDAVTEGYFRCYFYVETWIHTTVGNTMILMKLGNGATTAMDVRTYENASGIGLRAYVNAGADRFINLTTTEEITEDAWHYIDMYWKAGTPGNCEAWLDGNSKGSSAILNMSDATIDRCFMGGTGSNPANPGVIYFDDLIGMTTGPIGAYSDAGGGGTTAKMMHYARLRRN